MGKQNKKELFSFVRGIQTKEVDGARIVSGFIATTHKDSGEFNEELDSIVKDVILKETLELWSNEINQGNPRANKVSVNHDREDRFVAGAMKRTATVKQLPDGEYGLWVDHVIDPTHPQFTDINTRIDVGTLDSFSIEYLAGEPRIEDSGEGYLTRYLGTDTELHGDTLASRPMNENCVMIKEVMQKTNQKGEKKMEKETKTETNKEEKTEKMEDKKVEVKEIPLSKEDKELLTEAKERKKAAGLKEMMLKVMEDKGFQEKVMKTEPEKKPLQNKEEEEPGKEPEPAKEETEEKELSKRYVEIVSSKDISIKEKFRKVGLMAEEKGLLSKEGDGISYVANKSAEKVQFKNFTFDKTSTKMEFKALGITTNKPTDTDYLLSAAELRDMFDPVIYDALNQSTVTWGLLQKDDYSMKGNNQVQFVLRTKANSTAAFYTGNAVATGQSRRLKLQTKFKKVQVGISIDGDMIAAARGGPVGDVFGTEVGDSTEDLLTTVNSALFAEVGLETASAVIGFEYITDSAGNTTLYNLTRNDGAATNSEPNWLSPDAAGDTYINGSSARITTVDLAKAIEQATKEGANIGNLVFVCHPTQERLYKEIYRSMQRFVPTSSRFGFEGRPDFDGVPIFTDKDCNTDDWFLVDLETHRIAIWVPPTLEMLGKRSDAEEGFVKMYLATYNRMPRRMVQIYGCATS